MTFRTPEQALEAMRDGRQVYNGGELIDDVTTHPNTRRRALQQANSFESYHDERKDIFVTDDPETGEETDRFLVPPTNAEDLLARARAIDFGMRYGGPSFGSDAILSLRRSVGWPGSFCWLPPLPRAKPDHVDRDVRH